MGYVLAVTGYKPHEIGIQSNNHPQLPFLKRAVKKKLAAVIDDLGVEWVVVSGQMGVELWAAEALLDMKSDLNVKLAVLKPFYHQDERWPDEWKVYYESVCQRADYTDTISKRPYDSPAQLRMKNEFIIEKTDGLLVLYDEWTPGSPSYYIEAAEKKAEYKMYDIMYLTPDEIQDMIHEEAEHHHEEIDNEDGF
ncbi:SLOG family protein [Texcoconibacillus texcoconensis]|uniref:Putative phage-like protein YoqJ n=1 Tax=Texcoconibacillus texcoconensis TaxID=1095777 RepID=A0A840QT25_9BACI|nr:SLOG family protein [Texcoconibacillus texcoconensis]MBB5174514.1 putative phage-like protein YoqJ [Texcoconibacillus texcoconensis]